MPGAVKTRRWDDPRGPADGTRILVSRYRPRALPKHKETWDEWVKELGPSVELHAAFWGKHGAPIGWDEYERRFRAEIAGQAERIAALAQRVKAGETITLLCSSSCTDAASCHRSILRELIEAEVG